MVCRKQVSLKKQSARFELELRQNSPVISEYPSRFAMKQNAQMADRPNPSQANLRLFLPFATFL
jgi:hypothetical protein